MDIGNTDYQKQIKNINLDSPGVKVLEDWIKTGDMPKQANITYCDLCEFVIKAENDQYSRAHTNLNLPKDTNNIFNRGTSLWFRSDQKKRANYLYELIEDGMEKTIGEKITIRDTNRAKNQDKRAIERNRLRIYLKNKYSPIIHNTNNPEADNNLNSLKQKLKEYHQCCCCCCC